MHALAMALACLLEINESAFLEKASTTADSATPSVVEDVTAKRVAASDSSYGDFPRPSHPPIVPHSPTPLTDFDAELRHPLLPEAPKRHVIKDVPQGCRLAVGVDASSHDANGSAFDRILSSYTRLGEAPIATPRLAM